MAYPAQIRSGSVIVRVLDDRRFSMRDVGSQAALQLLEEQDVPELIRFLHQWSQSARTELRLTSAPEAAA